MRVKIQVPMPVSDTRDYLSAGAGADFQVPVPVPGNSDCLSAGA